MASKIDVKTFVREHSDVWHPNKYIRWEARAKIRRLLCDLPADYVMKVIEHLKYPCLMKQKEVYEGYLRQARGAMNVNNYKRILDHVHSALEDLDWIRSELGLGDVERPGWLDSVGEVMRAEELGGTLLAYVG